jgi:hypothetical protein
MQVFERRRDADQGQDAPVDAQRLSDQIRAAEFAHPQAVADDGLVVAARHVFLRHEESSALRANAEGVEESGVDGGAGEDFGAAVAAQRGMPLRRVAPRRERTALFAGVDEIGPRDRDAFAGVGLRR